MRHLHSTMTSRERILGAIEHRQPDRVPVDLASTPSSGISAIAYGTLKTHLGMASGATRVYDVVQQFAEPEGAILDRFGVDVADIGARATRKSRPGSRPCWPTATPTTGRIYEGSAGPAGASGRHAASQTSIQWVAHRPRGSLGTGPVRMAAGLLTTRMPTAVSAAIFSAVVPLTPAMMAHGLSPSPTRPRFSIGWNRYARMSMSATLLRYETSNTAA
jgi:hypothetical protein